MKDIELRRQRLETYRLQVGVNSLTGLILTLMLLIAAIVIVVLNPSVWVYSLIRGVVVILLGIMNYRYVKSAEKKIKRFTKELLEAEQALKNSESKEAEQALKNSESKEENEHDQHE